MKMHDWLVGIVMAASAVTASAQIGYAPYSVGYGYRYGVSTGFYSPFFSYGTSYQYAQYQKYNGFAPVYASPYGPVVGVPVAVPVAVPVVVQQPVVQVPVVQAVARNEDVGNVQPVGFNPNEFVAFKPRKEVRNPARAKPGNPQEDNAAPRALPELAPMKPDQLMLAMAQFETGVEAYNAGEYGRAAEKFRSSLQMNPQQPLPGLHLVQTLVGMSKYQEAATTLIELIENHPNLPRVVYLPRKMDEKRYDRSIVQLRSVIEANADDPVLHFLLGELLWYDGKVEEAKKALEEAKRRSIDPKPVQVYLDAMKSGFTVQ